MNNHQPILSTIFEGEVFNLGRCLGGDNFGLFLYVCIQMLICALIYSWCISRVSKLGVNRVIAVACSLFVGLAPYWSFASTTLHKDGMFLALFALYVTVLLLIGVELFIGHTIGSRKKGGGGEDTRPNYFWSASLLLAKWWDLYGSSTTFLLDFCGKRKILETIFIIISYSSICLCWFYKSGIAINEYCTDGKNRDS